MNEVEKRFANIKEVEPDLDDLKTIMRIKKRNDNSAGISLDDMDKLRAVRQYSGKISVRVPKDLHRELLESAKDNGVSLDQFIVYKLAKQ